MKQLTIVCGLLLLLVAGCSLAAEPPCDVTEPVWLKPPEDTAVSGIPDFGHYYANADQSIIASAWWWEQEAYPLQANDEGLKMGWFRPAGATLEITGRRLDGDAPPLDAHAPCCYPTRFQAVGVQFPSEGCWLVEATAADKSLSFVVAVAGAGGG